MQFVFLEKYLVCRVFHSTTSAITLFPSFFYIIIAIKIPPRKINGFAKHLF